MKYYAKGWQFIDLGVVEGIRLIKVFATCGDTWKVNSGIVNIDQDADNYYVKGISGSCYVLSKHSNHINPYGSYALKNVITILDGARVYYKLISVDEALEIFK